LRAGIEDETIGAMSVEENPVDDRDSRYGAEPDRSVRRLKGADVAWNER
jgi:hypothetical protein